jgi:sortase B
MIESDKKHKKGCSYPILYTLTKIVDERNLIMEVYAMRKWILRVILLLAIVGIAVSLWNLIPPYLDRRQSVQDYHELEEEIVSTSGEKQGDDWWSKDVHIAFEELKKKNSDIIGWIRFDNLDQIDISYPILYSGDDEKYLHTDLYGKSRAAGCIFLEGLNQPNLKDQYQIIYGHNMRNGSMFGSLKKYKKSGFYEKNPYFTVYTEKMAYRYQIFSVHNAKADGAVYQIGYGQDETYQKFLNSLAEDSLIDTGLTPKKTDRVLTLSTCTGNGYESRFAVHAVLVTVLPL